MVSSFYNGISGAKTYQFGIDSWSNNIANINTTGFKGSTPEFKTTFETVMSQSFNSSVVSNVGNGTTVGSNSMILSNGELEMSDDLFDLGITQDGWFVIGPSNVTDLKENFYSRNGDFHRDADGYIVNNQGHYLYGIDLGKIDPITDSFTSSGDTEIDRAGLIADGPLSPLRLPENIYYKPVVTTTASVQLNLNSSQNLKSIDSVFSVTDPLSGISSFDLDTFYQQDMNALGSADGSTKETFSFTSGATSGAQTYIDLEVATTVGTTSGSTTSTQTYRLKYGDPYIDFDAGTGLTEYGFTTVEEFMNLIADMTETTHSIGTGDEDSPECAMYFTLGNDGSIQTDISKNIKFSSNVPTIIDALGFPANIDLIEDTSMTSKTLYVPTYTSAVEIYDESGVKHQIVADYYLQTKDDLSNNADQEVWKFTAGVYDTKLNQISPDDGMVYEMVFESGSTTPTPPANPVTLTYNNNTEVVYDPYGMGVEGTTPTTQNSVYLDSSTKKSFVDGTREGLATQIDIDQDGIISIAFSNGKYESFGRVGIASFINDQGLQKIDSTTLKTMSVRDQEGNITIPSGEPRLMWRWDEEGEGRLSLATTSIAQYRLETANIMMATALTELMISQRAYSANAKAITTSDELIKEAIGLKR